MDFDERPALRGTAPDRAVEPGRPNNDDKAMKRAEAADAALEMAAAGRTAYICHDGGLRVGDSPSGCIILVIRPDHTVQREPLVALLTHRMRMKGVA